MDWSVLQTLCTRWSITKSLVTETTIVFNQNNFCGNILKLTKEKLF